MAPDSLSRQFLAEATVGFATDIIQFWLVEDCVTVSVEAITHILVTHILVATVILKAETVKNPIQQSKVISVQIELSAPILMLSFG